MRTANLMRPEISENEVRTCANPVRLNEIDIRTDDGSFAPEAMKLAREWYAAGVKATKQGAYASRIGKSSSELSEMLSGARPRHIHLVEALPLLADASTAKAFISWQCSIAGFVSPELEDTVQLSAAEARLLAWLMRTPVWRLFIGELIAKEFYRVDVELLEVAIKNATRGE